MKNVVSGWFRRRSSTDSVSRKLDNNEDFYLLEAARTGNLHMIQRLIDNGCNPRCVGSHNRGLMYLAAREGKLDVVKWLDKKVPDEIDRPDENGATPLFCAAYRGHESVVEYLLSTDRVNKNAQDWQGETPISKARQGGHQGVVSLLSRASVSAQTFCSELLWLWSVANAS